MWWVPEIRIVLPSIGQSDIVVGLRRKKYSCVIGVNKDKV